jgi:hypothetical protein
MGIIAFRQILCLKRDVLESWGAMAGKPDPGEDLPSSVKAKPTYVLS